jgi:hypothetical protein
VREANDALNLHVIILLLVVLTSVLHMVEVQGALNQVAIKVLKVKRISVLHMEVEQGAQIVLIG